MYKMAKFLQKGGEQTQFEKCTILTLLEPALRERLLQTEAGRKCGWIRSRRAEQSRLMEERVLIP